MAKMSVDAASGKSRKFGFTIAGKILFANCAIVAVGAFAGTWFSQSYSDQPSFVLGAVLFTGGLLISLPVNYVATRLALEPLRRLAGSMEQVQHGNLESEADFVPADRQIAKLVDSYNTMLARIKEDRGMIEKLSLVDPLTEVGNTRALHQGLETEIARIDRYGQNMPAAFSVLIIDLDNFKEINDTFGHLAGDEVLKDMAVLLMRSLRKTDTTLAALKHYRFGGDEFVVIAPHTSAAGAKLLVSRLQKTIGEFPFQTHEGVLLAKTKVGPVGASIGFASYPEETANADELMDLADKRMYGMKESKTRGRVSRLPQPGGFPGLGGPPLGRTGIYQD